VGGTAPAVWVSNTSIPRTVLFPGVQTFKDSPLLVRVAGPSDKFKQVKRGVVPIEKLFQLVLRSPPTSSKKVAVYDASGSVRYTLPFRNELMFGGMDPEKK